MQGAFNKDKATAFLTGKKHVVLKKLVLVLQKYFCLKTYVCGSGPTST